MITLLRVVAVLLGIVLLAALALCALALAAFSVPSGDGGLPRLLEWAALPEARDEVAGFLAMLEADGPVAVASALAAAGVVLGGLLLVLGALAGPERLLCLRVKAERHLAIRRRAVRGAVAARAGRVRGPTGVRVRVRRRRILPGPGTVRVSLRHSRRSDGKALSARVREEVAPLLAPFGLRLRVRARTARKNARAA